ncbi:MAG: carbamate kinase [Dehalococcoidia bacterium]|nr:MAG: carbamate kinase [Dehalococcoidia bacterium]
MLIVAALGGNALLRRGQRLDQSVQQRNIDAAVRSLAGLASDHRLVITHGNGPQVGLLALAQEAYRDATPYSLDVLGSETQGMIGYLVEEAMREALPAREVATLLTQVMVDPADPAFAHPTKRIGPGYTEVEARRLIAERGWMVARDGVAYRRIVASPAPQRILEMAAIRLLVEHDVTVICAGGGGVPVAADPSGAWRGVEAVIDKDYTAALLAREIHADLLLLLTDVDAVQLHWGASEARKIHMATPLTLRREQFAEGTMAPKVEAACRFVESTGHRAAIGSLDQAGAILRGLAGTNVVRDGITPMSFWPDTDGINL